MEVSLNKEWSCSNETPGACWILSIDVESEVPAKTTAKAIQSIAQNRFARKSLEMRMDGVLAGEGRWLNQELLPTTWNQIWPVERLNLVCSLDDECANALRIARCAASSFEIMNRRAIRSRAALI